MAIGTLAAIGLGAAGIGSALGASSSKKAAKNAAQAQLQATESNNALARDIYGKNEGYLAPYAQQGLPASYALNSFLGLTPTQPAQTMAQPNAMAQFAPQYGYEGYDGAGMGYRPPGMAFNPREPDIFGTNSIMGAPTAIGTTGYGSGTVQAGPMVSGRDAFKSFIENSDYGFKFGEGANAINSGYAGSGSIKSGAAMKALEDYRQNLQSGYRGEFLNLLGNQQGVGLSGASALAGVGQNYVNTISANNNNAADAKANAALIKGQNNPLANALGVLGGGLFGLGR